jgi:predicted outer membrane repeat protein
MTILRHVLRGLLVACLFCVASTPRVWPALAASTAVVGSGTAASCTEAALDAALVTAGLITFNCGPAPHTITLTAQKLMIAATTLDGGGRITLSGGGATRHFFVNGDVDAVFKNIVLANGYSPVGGGAIETSGGYVTLDSVTLSNNNAINQGGAIYCFIGTNGIMTVTNSTFDGNRSARGGAIFNSGCPVRISGGLFASNIATSSLATGKQGGAIFNAQDSRLAISGTQFLRNRAFDGGAIFVETNSSLHLSAATFLSNSASYGGAIENSGALTATQSAFRENSAEALGGALWALGGSTVISNGHFESNRSVFDGGAIHLQGSAYIRDSSFIANRAQGNGGALHASFDTVSVENTTFGENTAVKFGGALYADQKTLLKYITIYSNTSMAGALYGQDGVGVPEPVFAQAVLFAKNTGGSCGGKITSVRNSMADDMSCGGVLIAPNDKSNATLPFGALANAGVTRYYLPSKGNEGVDLLVGTDCFMMDGSAPRDQRGVARPQNAKCDSGAIEARANELGGKLFLPAILRER